MFLLISVPHALDENQFIFFGRRHVRIYFFQKAGRIAVGEIVVSADDECARVSNFFRLRKFFVVLSKMPLNQSCAVLAVQTTQPIK